MAHIIKSPPTVVDIEPCCSYLTTYQNDYGPKTFPGYGFYMGDHDEIACDNQNITNFTNEEPSCRCNVTHRMPMSKIQPVEWVGVATGALREPRIIPLKLTPEQRQAMDTTVKSNCGEKKPNRFYLLSMKDTHPALHQRVKYMEEQSKYNTERNSKECHCLTKQNIYSDN